MITSFIGLGSNIEPRENHLKRAIKLLKTHKEINVEKVSPIYETVPVGYLNQDKFLNQVIKISTSLSAIDLLDVCQSIERDLGREETFEDGPRTIDLDILLYNQEYRQLDRLKIPHPRLHERAFVLIPLNDVGPERIIPTSGKSVAELVERLPKKALDTVVKWKGNKS